jgi:hypothetical protein
MNGQFQSRLACLKGAKLRHRVAIQPNWVRQALVLAIGLVLVAASGAWVNAEPLIAVKAAPAMRLSAMAKRPVGFMATVSLEAVLPVSVPLAFSNKNESARSIC